jgi:hypothetical protein
MYVQLVSDKFINLWLYDKKYLISSQVDVKNRRIPGWILRDVGPKLPLAADPLPIGFGLRHALPWPEFHIAR